MSAIITIIHTILTSETAQKAVQGLALSGTKQLAEWIGQFAAQQQIQLPDGKTDDISRLILNDPSLLERLLSILQPKDKRGILIVGPSGSGKTALINSLNRKEPDETESTVEIDPYLTLLAGKMVMIRDSPGQAYLGGTGGLWDAVAEYKPKILVVVVAGGYLDSKGTENELKRPDPSTTPPFKTYAKLPDFLTATETEELTWVTTFKNLVKMPDELVKYVLLVVNKKEIWIKNQTQVFARYQGGPFESELDGLASKLAVPGQKPQVLSVSARYNTFKNKVAPNASFDRMAASNSVRLLKAYLAALLVDGNIG